jgi:hypothetical protein
MGANRNAVKEERERAIFNEFAEAVGFQVIADTLQSRQSPEPDVLCEIRGRGPVAFELVELIDQDFQERLTTLGRFDRLLRDYPNELTNGERAQFQQKYGNAAIGVTFKSLPLRQLRAFLPELFRWLRQDVPPDVSSLELDLPATLREAFDRVAVQRPMPLLDISATSSGFLADPTFDAVRDKLQVKRYATQHPKELLAYTTFDLLLPMDVWQPKFEQPLIALLHASTFQRLWVFSLGQSGHPGALKLVHPPL